MRASGFDALTRCAQHAYGMRLFVTRLPPITGVFDDLAGQGAFDKNRLAVNVRNASSFVIQGFDMCNRHNWLPRDSPAKGADYNRRMEPGRVAHNSTMSPAYTLLTDEAAYRQACDVILRRAESEILIFDRDLAALRVEEKTRIAALTSFLMTAGPRRIRIVLHDPEPAVRNAPNLMRLIARFSHLIDVRQSAENLRHLRDTHLLADESHGVRRFHVDQPRSALILDDPDYIQPWRQRFEELWELSLPCSSISTTGL